MDSPKEPSSVASSFDLSTHQHPEFKDPSVITTELVRIKNNQIIGSSFHITRTTAPDDTHPPSAPPPPSLPANKRHSYNMPFIKNPALVPRPHSDPYGTSKGAAVLHSNVNNGTPLFPSPFPPLSPLSPS